MRKALAEGEPHLMRIELDVKENWNKLGNGPRLL
jgi:hypothetical protein